MRVFKVSDGSSWVARVSEGDIAPEAGPATFGWDAIVFETDRMTAVQRLVYRPSGWLGGATVAELAAALEEGQPVRTRWGA
jgi:hypothetical protein